MATFIYCEIIFNHRAFCYTDNPSTSMLKQAYEQTK
ncbi:Uncharacterised protein [Budvicia aquatica]|uniref:Uncharacterized protein n=1 Tax=Budvicia aquatica TaxID=82979 RepID=A0A484ZWD3_9GAMM|nr:Uncharacterised protein [Budvicia aquatica]